jgi:surfactin synthase thioesterase subunit
MAASLGPEIEMLAVQYPGRQDRRRERRIEDIAELADLIFAALLPKLDRPFAFFGHSMGAVLAFEVARRLSTRTRTVPQRLFVSGRRAPSRHRPDDVHLRDDAGLTAELRQVAGADPRWLNDSLLRAIVLPMIRSDYTAIERYTCPPGIALDCPITVLVGDADPYTTIDEARAWRDHATGEFDLRVFPGGHFYLDERRSEVVATIAAILGRAVETNNTFVSGGVS